MKMPRLRSILITFLLSVSFVVTACTSEQPKQTATEAPTPTAPETVAETPTPIYTPTPTITPTQDLPNQDISGCWQSNYGSDTASITDKYNLEPGGNYSGSRKIIGINTGDTVTNYSGKWIVDNGYVLIQDDTRNATITLKVISEYELRSESDTAYSRC